MSEEATARDKELLLSDEYRPAEAILGESLPNWYYLEHTVASDKKFQFFLNSHSHTVPMESHAILFRWIMPTNPVIYSDEDTYSPIDRKVGMYRFSVGERFTVSEEEIRSIATGEKKVDQDYLAKLNKYMERSFLFNTFKIPMLDVRVDTIVENSFDQAFKIHTGKSAALARGIKEKQLQDQEKQKLKLLGQVKSTLKTYPDYLSILRRLVSEETTIEQAIKITGSAGIFTKGI